MKLSEIIQDARDYMDSPANSNRPIWSDDELVRHVNRHHRSIFRRQCQIDESWHNCDVNILKARFVQVAPNLWDFRMPGWAERIVQVFVRTPPSGTDNESPALTAAISLRGGKVPLADMYMKRPGWRWQSNRTLRLVGFGQPIDLVVQCAKVPAKLTRGAIDQTGPSTSSFYLRQNPTASEGEHDLEANAYRNAVFEFACTETDTTTITGLRRVCVASDVVFALGARRTLITLDAALPRVLSTTKADSYEMHAETSEPSGHFLALLAAQSCFIKRHNKEGLVALSAELQHEAREFAQHVAPRSDEPKFVRSEADVLGGRTGSFLSEDDAPAGWGY